MPDRSRIPRGITNFNSYLVNTTTLLIAGNPTNAERLGVLSTEQDQWSALLAEWNPLYEKYCDKKNSRTTAIKDQLLYIISKCVLFDQKNHILNRIASSPNVTVDDLLTFNIKQGVLRKTTHSVSHTPIKEKVNVHFTSLGGGSFKIKCFSNTNRASLPEGADSVQYLLKIGNTPPTSAESAGMSRDISSKSMFVLALGPANSAKYLYIYFRWYNTRHPELAGPWSGLQTALIV